MKKGFKEQIASDICGAIRSVCEDKLRDIIEAFGVDEAGFEGFIDSKLEIPKDRKLGDYAFPTFILAKVLKEKPVVIAGQLLQLLDKDRFSAAGPYINCTISAPQVAEAVLPVIHEQGKHYGDQAIGGGNKVVIDFSSPNIAKPFGIGHLRSTAIGNSLYHLYEKLGYDCIGVNHLGDWGTQFGKMILAYVKWGTEEELKKDPVKYLYSLYVRFHREEKEDSSLSTEARAWFKKLEDGDEKAISYWKLFKDHSLEEFKRIYEILGIRFDHYTGESFYNDKMDAAIERLEAAGLTKESQGALIVDLEEYGMTPCLLRKADGATLYSTRDLAGMFYRYETFNFDRALYVVGSAQREHFKQVFKVIELLGEEFADRLVHVEFGWIKFDDKAMKSREGTVIFLEDVIDTATEKAVGIIKEKNPDLPNLEKTARTIGLGAIIFADLGVKRHKDVNFIWEEVLSFEGETGPYLQYTHARLSALMRKYGKEITSDVDFELFDSPEEKALLMHLYRFGGVVQLAADQYEPNFIAEYLLELAAIFNRFYQRKDADGRLIKIISDQEQETRARMLLVSGVRTVLKEGLRLLGIQAPEEM
jgi:arginyl-tRNA synthetase